MEWLQVLPNLSIGVVSVIALVYVTIRFINTLETRAQSHQIAMTERESALRKVEGDIRDTLTKHITVSSQALAENTKVLERVINHLDRRA